MKSFYRLCRFLFVLSIVACSSKSPLTVTSNPTDYKKVGKSCGHYIGLTISENLAFRVSGDEDIATAVKDAQLSSVSFVDRETDNYFFYKKQCTLVYGL